MSFTPETLLRHWQTLRLIPRSPRKITAGEVCSALEQEGFSVGKRTVERDLLALARIFPLVVDDREKPYGWSWRKDAPSFDLPGLSTSESLALLMAREYLHSLMPGSVQTQLAPYFHLAEQKIEALAGHSSLAEWQEKVRIIPPAQPLLPPSIDPEIEAMLQEALLLNKQCVITYLRKDAPKPDEYPINPLGLVQRGAVLYLICTIKTYSDIRILAMHRIKTAQLSETPIIRPDSFILDNYLAQGAFGWGVGDSIQLIAIFSREAGSHLYETPLSADQYIEITSDSRLKIRATVPNTKQLCWWLLGFGDGVTVEAPSLLRETIKSTLLTASKQYQDREKNTAS